MDRQNPSVLPLDVMSSQDLRYCVFRNGPSWFAVPSLEVREVMQRPDMVFVPGTPDLFIGLCHVRSEFIPVLNLRSVVSESGDSNEPILILIENPDGVWGFLADEVASLQQLDLSDAPETDWLENQCSVVGWATFGDAIVQILDPSRIRRLAEKQLAEMWQSTHLLARYDVHESRSTSDRIS